MANDERLLFIIGHSILGSKDQGVGGAFRAQNQVSGTLGGATIRLPIANS
ncbi:hypothetical protein [Lentilactobacillus rapi]|nr:hypothetical protein [Lentilactobacillus rapi]